MGLALIHLVVCIYLHRNTSEGKCWHECFCTPYFWGPFISSSERSWWKSSDYSLKTKSLEVAL